MQITIDLNNTAYQNFFKEYLLKATTKTLLPALVVETISHPSQIPSQEVYRQALTEWGEINSAQGGTTRNFIQMTRFSYSRKLNT